MYQAYALTIISRLLSIGPAARTIQVSVVSSPPNFPGWNMNGDRNSQRKSGVAQLKFIGSYIAPYAFSWVIRCDWLIMYASISFELNSWAAAAGTIFGIYWRPAIAQLEMMRGYYQG
jgi:hypothetical protein